MEKDVVIPIKPKFYKRYVDDTFAVRKIGSEDVLFKALSNYHPNIKLTIEVIPSEFLDTEIIRNDYNILSTKVHRKANKLPVYWSSQIPNKYKRNAIIGDSYRSKKIASNFRDEVIIIRKKFIHADYPRKFVDSVIRDFDSPISLSQ